MNFGIMCLLIRTYKTFQALVAGGKIGITSILTMLLLNQLGNIIVQRSSCLLESSMYFCRQEQTQNSLTLNTWFRYDNHPLKSSLEQFAHFPIATSSKEGQKQPRLLLVSVDVREGAAVTFDIRKWEVAESLSMAIIIRLMEEVKQTTKMQDMNIL
jgi:hypothetical protein